MIDVPAAIMQPIDATLSAINADRPDALDQYFSENATVVDELSPFMWSGAHAASRWFKHVDAAVSKATGAPGVRATVGGVTEYRLDHEGDDAFVTVSLGVNPLSAKKQPEEGLWVLTLHRTGESWKITSATWATLPNTR